MCMQWAKVGSRIYISVIRKISIISAPEDVILHSSEKIPISRHFSRHKAWRTGLSAIRQAFTILAIPSIGDPQQAVIAQVATGFLCNFAFLVALVDLFE